MSNPLPNIGAVAGIPGTDHSQRDLEHAAESARDICSKSPIVQNMIANMIISRQLYMVARSAMDNELKHGWNCDDPALVSQTLTMSATERANSKYTIDELIQGLLRTSLPMLDIVSQQARELGEPICPEEPQEENDAAATTSNGDQTPDDE